MWIVNIRNRKIEWKLLMLFKRIVLLFRRFIGRFKGVYFGIEIWNEDIRIKMKRCLII